MIIDVCIYNDRYIRHRKDIFQVESREGRYKHLVSRDIPDYLVGRRPEKNYELTYVAYA